MDFGPKNVGHFFGKPQTGYRFENYNFSHDLSTCWTQVIDEPN